MASWRNVQLSDIATVIAGQSPEGRFYNQTGAGIPFLQGSAEFGAIHPVNTLHTTHVTKIAPQGAILFSVRAPVAELNIADQAYCIGRGLAAIISKPQTNRDFLYQLLLFNTSRFRRLSQGSTFESINTEQLKSIRLVVPNTLSDQSAIAEVLKYTDNLITRTADTIAKHERIRAGLLHDLLTRGVDEQGRLRSEETHEFKDSPIGRIPAEWEVVLLRKIANAIDPQPDHRTPAEVKDGVAYIGIGDFYPTGKINFQRCRRISEEAFTRQRKRFEIEKFDVVFGKIGTIGQPKLLVEAGFALSANIILLKPKVASSFLYWLLTTDRVNREVDNEVARTTQPAFGIEKIRSLKVAKPTDNECMRIAKILDEQEEARQLLIGKLHKLHRIKTGLLHDLLTPPQATVAASVLQEAEALPA